MEDMDEKQHSTESLVEVAVLKCARHVVTGISIHEGRAAFRIAQNPAVTPIPEIVEALYADRYGVANPFDLIRAYKQVSRDMHTLLDAARDGQRSNDDERDAQQGRETPGA